MTPYGPFTAQIQRAINVLRAGLLSFVTLVIDASGYINFGSTTGTTGYGFRDNSGTVQIKNNGGSWANVGTAAGKLVQRVQPLTGDSVTITTSPATWLLIVPADTIAAFTVAMPASPTDGDEVYIGTSQTITSLTMTGNGNTLFGPSTTLNSVGVTQWRFYAADSAWYRF